MYKGSLEEHNQKILNSIVSTNYPNRKDFIDLSGRKIGRLHVDKRIGRGSHHETFYKCTCECGNIVYVNAASLRSGSTKSCGCLARELNKTRIHINTNKKHGYAGTKLYKVWKNMRNRCHNPKYAYYHQYGGRGIKICDEWDNPDTGSTNFIHWALESGYEEGLTLDRIDNDGNYCPENCRWVSMKHQDNNRSSNHYVQIERWVFSLSIWADITGNDIKNIRNRIQRGWTEYEAIMTPPTSRHRNPLSILDIPFEYEKYNKYDEWVKKGKIKPVEETIYKDCPYIEHK